MDQPTAIPLSQSIELQLSGQPYVKNKWGIGHIRPERVVFYYLEGRVNAHLFGSWVREDDEVTDQPVDQLYWHDDAWPEWLTPLARKHAPAATPSVDRAALRDRIGLAIHSELTEYRLGRDTGLIVQRLTDAALRVLPPAADRAVLLEAAEALDADMERFFAEWPDEPRNSPYALGRKDAADELRRLAAENPQPEQTLNLGDGPVRCPLCPHPVTLHTPSGARSHFAAVHPEQRITGRGSGPWPLLVTDGAEPAAGPPQPETQATPCDDPIECGHEAALGQARETNRRLNLRAQQLESELATYRRAVGQWEVSERGTYIPHASLRAIGQACGVDILGSLRHLKHFQRVEQAEAAVARLRKLHDNLAAETDLTSPDDEITRGAAAKRIATALDGWNPTGLPGCDAEFEGGSRCAKPAGHRQPGSDDPHVPDPATTAPPAVVSQPEETTP